MVGRRMEAISIVGREVMVPRGIIGLGYDSLDYCGGAIREIFETVAVPTNMPVLIHCTQGKDRTGIVVALLLLLCQVPIPSITADYLISEDELKSQLPERMAEIREVGLTPEFAGCPPDWIEKMNAYIVDKYGGIEAYLEFIGVDETTRTDVMKALVNNM